MPTSLLTEGLHDNLKLNRRELWITYNGQVLLHGWAAAQICGAPAPITGDLFERHLPFGTFK